MKRLALVLVTFLAFATVAAQAKTYDPPLTGDMVGLEVFSTPQEVPEVLLSHLPQGLSYLSEFKGEFFIMNMWATWCPPCVEELPSLNALQMSMGSNDFQIVAVSMEHDKPDVVKKYMEDNKLKSLVPYVDVNGDISKIPAMKDVAGIPVTLFFDRKLRVIARLQGSADWNGRSARAVVEYFQKNLPAAYASDD